MEELQRQCVDLEDEVKRNMKYEEFLERAKEYTADFSEIQDLLTRSSSQIWPFEAADVVDLVEANFRLYQKYSKLIFCKYAKIELAYVLQGGYRVTEGVGGYLSGGPHRPFGVNPW